MSAEKRCLFLRIPTRKPANKYEINLRTQLHGYRLDADPMCNTCEIMAILNIVKLYLKIWHLILLREFIAYTHIQGRIKSLIFFEKSIMDYKRRGKLLYSFYSLIILMSLGRMGN